MATSVFADDSRGAADRPMAEINITPLVDVMLVLLIIFMVAAPLVTRTLDLRLPQAPSTGPVPPPPPRVQLAVQPDGSYVLDGVALGSGGLEPALGAIARSTPKAVLAIAVHEDAEYQAFTRVLVAARRTGIANIALEP